MEEVVIYNRSRPQVHPVLARYCASFFCRLRGLTFSPPLPLHKGLLLVQAEDSRWNSSVHMLGVNMKLALVWINSQFEVVDVKMGQPWRLAYFPKHSARYVLELNESRIRDFEIGDKVRFDES